MKKQHIVLTLSLAIATSSLLMTACGNKEETVSAMNTIPVETEVSTETTDISETESETETESITETEVTTETEVETSAKEYTLEVMDVTMYALSDSYTYDGPSTSDYDQKATVHEEEQVRVIGKVNEADWYKIEQEGGIESFISAEFLTEEAPAVEEPVIVQSSQPAQNQTTPSTQNQVQQPQPETPQPEEQTPPSTPKREVAGEVSVASEPGGRLINPATGEYYKEGDTFSDGSIYGGMHKSSDYGF